MRACFIKSPRHVACADTSLVNQTASSPPFLYTDVIGRIKWPTDGWGLVYETNVCYGPFSFTGPRNTNSSRVTLPVRALRNGVKWPADGWGLVYETMQTPSYIGDGGARVQRVLQLEGQATESQTDYLSKCYLVRCSRQLTPVSPCTWPAPQTTEAH